MLRHASTTIATPNAIMIVSAQGNGGKQFSFTMSISSPPQSAFVLMCNALRRSL